MSDVAVAIRELAAAVRGDVPRPDPPPRDPVRVYDVLGRKVPTRLDWWSYARMLPGFAARFDREVPPEFVARVDEHHLEVSCPCGAAPLLELYMPVVCDCSRIFVDLGRWVKVARPDGDAG